MYESTCMFDKLSNSNNNLIFDIGSSGHSGWNKIYSDKENINWLLSWKKNKI